VLLAARGADCKTLASGFDRKTAAQQNTAMGHFLENVLTVFFSAPGSASVAPGGYYSSVTFQPSGHYLPVIPQERPIQEIFISGACLDTERSLERYGKAALPTPAIVVRFFCPEIGAATRCVKVSPCSKRKSTRSLLQCITSWLVAPRSNRASALAVW
jgi:hypothetical protein